MSAASVLAVMDRGIATLMDGNAMMWTARDLLIMREAVAELAEAAAEFLDLPDVEFTATCSDAAAVDRLDVAIANVQGGEE